MGTSTARHGRIAGAPALAAGGALLLALALPAAAAPATADAGVADWLENALHWITRAIEIAGIAAIVVGASIATGRYARAAWRGAAGDEAYHGFRAGLGRAILLGLEFLVAADIIATVAIEPTLDSLAVLAGIVLIRTFLSFALQIEIEGRPPWRKRPAAGDRAAS
uniref:DUF1622 domain-containing protein n=1 Tax=Aquibium sp. A9E412 TaxID=2976767 RepID=UPI00339D791A